LEVTKISGFQIGKNSSLKSKIVSLAGSKLVIILSRIYTNLNTNFTNNGQFAPCEGARKSLPVEGRQEEEEEMKRIYAARGVFWVSDGERTPIPPFPFVWEGEAELVVRLRSTRGGNNAWWAAGEKAVEALNDAPFNPVLRAVVESFTWSPPSTRDNPHPIPFGEPEVPPQEVWQGGTLALNFKARVVSPLPDPVRQKIQELEEVYWRYKQGALEVSDPIEFSEVSILSPAGSGSRWLFNHCIRPVSWWAWRVIHRVAYAIAIPPFEAEMYILSPDHPHSPLQLEFIPGTAYLMRHPLPRDTVD
jgi:hypothetical protein